MSLSSCGFLRIGSIFHAFIPRRLYRVVFFGSDAFSCAHLTFLAKKLESDCPSVTDLSVVTPNLLCPAAELASRYRLACQPWRRYVREISSSDYKSDVGIVASFGYLIPMSVIKHFKLALLNVHPSLLPRWRGAAPLIYTIFSGDEFTGISIMRISAEKFDNGAILLQNRYPMSRDVLRPQLLQLAAQRGVHALRSVLEDLPRYLSIAQPQQAAGATLARKVKRQAGCVDWAAETVDQLDRHRRALHGMMSLQTKFNGRKVYLLDCGGRIPSHPDVHLSPHCAPGALRMNIRRLPDILFVKCKDGWFPVRRLSLGKPLSPADFYNGYRGKYNFDEKPFESQRNPLLESIVKYDIR